jgi:hypothetical protein
VEVATAVRPGEVLRRPDGPVLVTAQGGLRFDEPQPAGGRRMGGDEYLRGRPD